jgi:hypothetical protein
VFVESQKFAAESAMQNDAKQLIEIATVNLLYAQAEIKCHDQRSEALRRIGRHLAQIATQLSALTSVLNAAEDADGEADGKQRRCA